MPHTDDDAGYRYCITGNAASAGADTATSETECLHRGMTFQYRAPGRWISRLIGFAPEHDSIETVACLRL